MKRLSNIDGSAALAICESLLLALTDRKILDEREVVGLMEDAAVAHRNATTENGDDQGHLAVAELIEAIIDGGNSVRRRR